MQFIQESSRPIRNCEQDHPLSVPNRGIPTSCMPLHLISSCALVLLACHLHDVLSMPAVGHREIGERIIWLSFPPFVRVAVPEVAPRLLMNEKPNRGKHKIYLDQTPR